MPCTERRLWIVGTLMLASLACGSPPQVADSDRLNASPSEGSSVIGSGHLLPPPAGAGAMAPYLSADPQGLVLSWLEPRSVEAGPVEGGPPVEAGPVESPGHEFRMATFEDGLWSESRLIHAGADFFANWADVPGIEHHPDGSLIAHWLEKTNSGSYDYAIELARSTDGGLSWSRLGRLNDDQVDGEHGFVSYAAEGDLLRAFWLDGREMAADGPMTLRTALIGPVVEPSEALADRVCECCPTTAAAGPDGAWVAYRGRSEEEVRDIVALRTDGSSWSAPMEVSTDHWQISGCPVNGPAMDALDGELAVAWFSAPSGQPSVAMAFAAADGTGLEAPLTVDEGKLLGRVDLVLTAPGEAVVSWLAVVDARAELRLAKIDRHGNRGEPLVLTSTTASRSGGYPELERRGDQLYLAWVETEGDAPSGLSFLELPISALSAPVPAPAAAGGP